MDNFIPMLLWLFLCLGAAGLLTYFCKKDMKAYVFPISILGVFILAAFLYRPYLIGSSAYLYAVHDGAEQYLPNYMNFVNGFKNGTFPSWWNLTVGFGSVRSYDSIFYPFNLLPILFGALFQETAMEIAFAWMQVLKIVLSATFTFLFLRKLKISSFACMIASLLFAFSGIIILRGFWIFPADECFLIMFLLWSVECYFQGEKWYGIPLAVALLVSCIGIYYIYLYGLLLVVYATIRYIYAHRPAKKYLKFMFTSGLLFLLGAMLLSVITFGFSSAMFETERFSATGSRVSLQGIFSCVDLDVFISGLFSMFNPSANGIFSAYHGALNYLERPIFYCGLITLYLIPQAFALSNKKQRILMGTGVAFSVLYMVFPFITDILNAFILNEELGARSYRLSSLWICVMFLVMGAYGLHQILKNHGCHKETLYYSAMALIAIFLFCCIAAPVLELTINISVCFFVVGLLIAWPLLLNQLGRTIYSLKIQNFFLIGTICLCLLEVACSAGIIINASQTDALKKHQTIEKSSVSYYGDVPEAVAYLEEKDNGLYRVALLHSGEPMYCAPTYFGVFDSSYYISINHPTYQFIHEILPEAGKGGEGKKSSIGVGANADLNMLTGYKYILRADEEQTVPEGYSKIKSIGTVEIYENMNYLSFGFAYDKYIFHSDFEKYTEEERQRILLSAIVLEDDTRTNLPEITSSEIEDILNSELEPVEVLGNMAAEIKERGKWQITQWKEDYIQGIVDVDKDSVFFISLPNVNGWTATVDGVKTTVETANVGFMGISLPAGKHNVQVSYYPRNLTLGIGISAIMLILYLLLLIFHWRPKTQISNLEAGDAAQPADSTPSLKTAVPYKKGEETLH